MKNTISGNRIALAGIGATVSLGALIASFYISQISLSLNILAAFGIMIPLAKQYYKEAIIAYVAVCLLGGIFANIHIISFVIVGGFYTIVTVAIFNKKIKLKTFLAIILKIVYSCFVFFILYFVTKIFIFDVAKIGASLSAISLYVVLNIVFSALFILYDFLLIYVYKLIVLLVEKVAKGR